MSRLDDLQQIGAANDTVHLRLGGKLSESEEIAIAENYEIKMSILQQPAAFTLRLGWSKTAAEILSKYPPGTPFELRIGTRQNPVVVQSGVTMSRAVPQANFTQIEIGGRDYLAALFDSFVEEEQSFTQATYYDLTRKVLDLVGLTEAKGHYLEKNNDNNRKLISGVTKAPRDASAIVEELETGAQTGTGKLIYNTIKAKVGTRYYDFLQKQYKLAGLFLWATGEGNFVLSRPNPNQDPAFRIFRSRDLSVDQTNVLDCHYRDDVTMRHARCLVYGRHGGRKAGRTKFSGEYVDQEMVDRGFNTVIVHYDADAKTQQEADYLARKIIAEERRAGWQLEYTVSGHRVISPANKIATWGPDLMCRVDDSELDIHDNFYIEAVTFRRSPATTTTVTLMRPEDLVFADKLP